MASGHVGVCVCVCVWRERVGQEVQVVLFIELIQRERRRGLHSLLKLTAGRRWLGAMSSLKS
jgi:hypothetical protein